MPDSMTWHPLEAFQCICVYIFVTLLESRLYWTIWNTYWEYECDSHSVVVAERTEMNRRPRISFVDRRQGGRSSEQLYMIISIWWQGFTVCKCRSRYVSFEHWLLQIVQVIVATGLLNIRFRGKHYWQKAGRRGLTKFADLCSGEDYFDMFR